MRDDNNSHLDWHGGKPKGKGYRPQQLDPLLFVLGLLLGIAMPHIVTLIVEWMI